MKSCSFWAYKVVYTQHKEYVLNLVLTRSSNPHSSPERSLQWPWVRYTLQPSLKLLPRTEVMKS